MYINPIKRLGTNNVNREIFWGKFLLLETRKRLGLCRAETGVERHQECVDGHKECVDRHSS